MFFWRSNEIFEIFGFRRLTPGDLKGCFPSLGLLYFCKVGSTPQKHVFLTCVGPLHFFVPLATCTQNRPAPLLKTVASISVLNNNRR